MIQTYFLGANSRDGFASLYRYFPGGEGAYLHILKGGPGTGKSGFMRRIGEAAEARGLEVHYVLCSGDPDSLDGVYLPQRKLAWVDGTAPHSLEPGCFGVDGDYVNLGVFCRTPLDAPDRERVLALTRQYRSLYREVYRLLADGRPGVMPPGVRRSPSELLRGVDLRDALPCPPQQRFLHTVSCQGEFWLEGEIEKLCKLVVPVTEAELAALSLELQRRELPAIRCPSPLDPARLEALLLPWAGTAYQAPRSIAAPEAALSRLGEAKALHDEIEAVYKPYVDFTALTAFTDETVSALFPE